MGKKETIRKKYLIKRKKNYFEVNKFFFDPLIKLIRKKFYKKKSLFLCTIQPNLN